MWIVWYNIIFKRLMKIERTKHDEIFELQEDLAEYVSDNYFPISGETYWKIVEAIALAKQVELTGIFDHTDNISLQEELESWNE